MAAAPRQPGGKTPEWLLRLYVADDTPRSVLALANLRRICEQHLAGSYRIEVVDLLDKPERARADQIIAVPTLVRARPEPIRRIVGDLTDTGQVLLGLGLLPNTTAPRQAE